MTLAEQSYAEAFEAACRPDRAETVSQWADRYRMLSGVASAEPGRWRTERTPYLREIMDCLSPGSPIQRVVVMAGAQIGKTECGNNWLGYIVDACPGPILMVQPTVEVAKRVSKQRIAPMIEATPRLRDAVRDPRSRDSGNTIFVKEFEGGLLIMTGANSAAGLRSMPIRFLFCDEVDLYPGDVEGEGDPVELAEQRTATFPRRKVFLCSTPRIKGMSRIETQFLASDQRRYFLACPSCGHRDYLTWSGHDWFGAESGRHHFIEWDEHKPETARMVCSGCDARVEERHKAAMLAGGEWRATNPKGRPAGFHLSALYSPLGWKSWAECARQFLASKDDPFKLKTWINTVLGEPWEERGTAIEAGTLAARRERYEAEVPHGVGVLVASVDVHPDRLECAVKGYGAGEESWLIAFSQFHGSPGHHPVWYDLDQFLKRGWEHASGRMLAVECVTVDSGGHHTEHVYKFCKARLASRTPRRVFPVKGGTVRGVEVVGRPSIHNRYRVPLFTLCTDTAKDLIYSRLAIPKRAEARAGYVHLPEWVDHEYLEQLTAEKAVRRWYKGKGTLRDWVKIRDRNEALDLEVYCLAALYILGQTFVEGLGERAAAFSEKREPDPVEAPGPAEGEPRAGPPRRRAGWVNSWRG